MQQQTSAYPSVGEAIGIFGMSLLFGLAIGFPMMITGLILDQFQMKTPLVDSFLSMCIYIGSFYLTFRWARKNMAFSHGDNYKMPLAMVPVMVLIVGSLMVLALGILTDPITSLIPRIEMFEEMMMRAMRPNIFSFITIAIAAPVLEELVFRGIILNGFLKRYSPTKAILLSSLIFGLVHLNPSQVISAFFAGVLLGWMYWKTGSLIPGILLHFVNNCFAFILMMVLSDPNASLYCMVGSSALIYGGIMVGSSLLIWLGYRYVQKRYKSIVVK